MHLEIDFSAIDPPEGDISSSSAADSEQFAGWLALVGAIEHLLTTGSEKKMHSADIGVDPAHPGAG